MKKYFLFVLIGLMGLTGLTGCVDEEEFADTPQGNFEALWRIIDEHYCFFDYKQHEYGLDWQQVYNKYKVQINSNMTQEQLFEVLGNMLGELRDGHVNLSASHDMARYWQWYEPYPSNYSDSLIRRYMGTDYRIASGLKYKILDDNIHAADQRAGATMASSSVSIVSRPLRTLWKRVSPPGAMEWGSVKSCWRHRSFQKSCCAGGQRRQAGGTLRQREDTGQLPAAQDGQGP